MGAMDLQLEFAAVQHGQAKLNVEVHAQGSSLSDGNYMAAKINGSNSDDYERLEKGVMQSGCAHYRRRCHIRAPCCNEIFYCRHCHNEAKFWTASIAVLLHHLIATSTSISVGAFLNTDLRHAALLCLHRPVVAENQVVAPPATTPTSSAV